MTLDEAFFSRLVPFVATAIQHRAEPAQAVLKEHLLAGRLQVHTFVNAGGPWVRVYVGPLTRTTRKHDHGIVVNIHGSQLGIYDLLDTDTAAGLLVAVDAAEQAAAAGVPDDASELDDTGDTPPAGA